MFSVGGRCRRNNRMPCRCPGMRKWASPGSSFGIVDFAMEQSPASVGVPINGDSAVSSAASNGSAVSEATPDLPDFRNSYLPMSRIIPVDGQRQLVVPTDHTAPVGLSKLEICTDG